MARNVEWAKSVRGFVQVSFFIKRWLALLGDVVVRLVLVSCTILLGAGSAQVQAIDSKDRVINICISEASWYPFTFMADGEAAGIHVDIVSAALSNLEYAFTFRALPWKRCLLHAEQGLVDGIVSASYNSTRAGYLYFPDDVISDARSDYRITQVEYVVVTHSENSYRFDGDIQGIPTPVRAPRGYSIVDDLIKQGFKVDDGATSDERNIQKLLREQNGSVVLIPEIAEQLSRQEKYKDRIRISEKVWKSKSYFFPLSMRSTISEPQRASIWKEIESLRNDTSFISRLTKKYSTVDEE